MNIHVSHPKYSRNYMSRCDDAIFYRIFCITLLGTALAFTVILTNVFVDIDGLLSRQTSQIVKQQPPLENVKAKPPTVDTKGIQTFISDEDGNPDDLEISYRAKRSLDSNHFLFHIKNPKMKKVLTNRLATLLQELDEEQTPVMKKSDRRTDLKVQDIIKENFNINLNAEDVRLKSEAEHNSHVEENEGKRREVNRKDMLHLAMHNILLQGIIGHMDLSEVYKKVHKLVKNYDTMDSGLKETELFYKNSDTNTVQEKPKELMKIVTQDSYNEEDKFFEELINCEKLQEEISQRKNLTPINNDTTKDSPMLIKTVIEITNIKNTNENLTNTTSQVKGDIKIIYNGQPISFQQLPSTENNQPNQPTETDNIDLNIHETDREKRVALESDEAVKVSQLTARKHHNDPFIDQAIAEYLKARTIKVKRHPGRNLKTKERYETKRLKRQIRIHYKDQGKARKIPVKTKKDDDELYVEIETHFDGKGAKGEKKKKIVRTLIDKIQKAIHSDIDLDKDKLARKPVQIKKRTQISIAKKNDLNNGVAATENIEHRLLNPISKTTNVVQPLASVLDKSGETWKKMYNGPGFLTVAKSLNSAEMSELDIDYNSVMKNGIPKRLQKPLNTENDDLIKPNAAPDYGDVTLYLKDIDGSGFSIGLNQYKDEAPDRESLKMFNGLEDLIRTYHEQYDQASDESEGESVNNVMEENHEITRRDINKQIYNYNALGYKRNMRQKRSAINVKMISNIKSKKKLNKYLNTNAMQTKKIFLKSKRNKRQVDKIRIVASDDYPRRSEEKIFLISHEDIFADRAIVKEVETPEVQIGDREDHYDVIAPYVYPYNMEPAYISVYDAKSMRSNLMSKYPHILMGNVPKSQEDYFINPENSNFDQTEIYETHNNHKSETETTKIKENSNPIEMNTSIPKVEEIVNAILPARTNYKLTVKILPRNQSTLGPGFKEMHTTINKSFHKDGMRYISSVNVSEISKIESMNKSKDVYTDIPVKNETAQQNEIKVLLELYKERIDQQLKHLQKESQSLNQMIGNENKEHWNKNISHLINLFRHLESRYKEYDATRTTKELNLDKNNTNLTTITPLTIAPEPPIRPVGSSTKIDIEKTEVLNTIKHNENITKQILLKIDKNTDILQSFLHKLTDKLQPVTPQNIITTDTAETHAKFDMPSYRRHEHNIPYYDLPDRNESKAMPFIYAFQQPIPQTNENAVKSNANIVYHGHIHANKAQNYDNKIGNFWKGYPKQKLPENDSKLGLISNETKFFIDELENDYKLASNINDRAAPVISATIKMNTTNIE